MGCCLPPGSTCGSWSPASSSGLGGRFDTTTGYNTKSWHLWGHSVCAPPEVPGGSQADQLPSGHQALYQKSMQALDLLLQAFISENESMDEICFLLQVRAPSTHPTPGPTQGASRRWRARRAGQPVCPAHVPKCWGCSPLPSEQCGPCKEQGGPCPYLQEPRGRKDQPLWVLLQPGEAVPQTPAPLCYPCTGQGPGGHHSPPEPREHRGAVMWPQCFTLGCQATGQVGKGNMPRGL